MFITFEGLDGSGKTTQVQRLASWLRTQGQGVLQLREPGGTRIGDAVRVILHDRIHTNMNPRAELLLYCASRAQLIVEQVQPHLKDGGVVLSDRFADSTLAYQGYGRGLDMNLLHTLLEFATQGVKPDLTLYFDVDPERALQRRMASGEVTRLDAEKMEFHLRVRDGYQKLIALEPQRWHIIDANVSQDQVAAQIKDLAKTRLNIAD